jgi:hypothetical protein
MFPNILSKGSKVVKLRINNIMQRAVEPRNSIKSAFPLAQFLRRFVLGNINAGKIFINTYAAINIQKSPVISFMT